MFEFWCNLYTDGCVGGCVNMLSDVVHSDALMSNEVVKQAGWHVNMPTSGLPSLPHVGCNEGWQAGDKAGCCAWCEDRADCRWTGWLCRCWVIGQLTTFSLDEHAGWPVQASGWATRSCGLIDGLVGRAGRWTGSLQVLELLGLGGQVATGRSGKSAERAGAQEDWWPTGRSIATGLF